MQNPVAARSLQFCNRLFRLSLSSLPFFYYLSLTGLFAVLVTLIARCRRSPLDAIIRNGLLLLSLLLLLSSLTAVDRGEAFLQTANFIPFFLFFAFVPYLLRGTEKLERLAIALVITTIPINLTSLGEYVLKSPWVPQHLQKVPFVHWVRSMPHANRAMVMFDHPNAFASYLVLILGLGLGVILKRSAETQLGRQTAAHRSKLLLGLIYGGTYLNLLGIFCSGSRNGLLVAITQLVTFSLFVKASRVIMLTGIASLAIVVAGAAFLGIGGRALSIASWADDPRVAVWQIALDLIGQRPWLGWGLGSFKLLYPPRAISEWYPYIYHPHNFWLLLGAEAGIGVAIVLTLLVGYVCYRTAKRMVLGQIDPLYRAMLLGYYFAFWGCIAFALFDVTFYDARINSLNWAILAGIYAAAAETPGASEF
jgi:O-antigen ligase